MSKPSIAIIGGGIVGLATGLEFTQRFPSTSLAIIEKEPALARHQTGHNSGVIHSGVYYKPGSLKAQLCVAGAKEMVEFCERYGIPYQICGKLIVATTAEEVVRLEDLFARGQANGVTRLRLLGPEPMREIEPHVAGLRAL